MSYDYHGHGEEARLDHEADLRDELHESQRRASLRENDLALCPGCGAEIDNRLTVCGPPCADAA